MPAPQPFLGRVVDLPPPLLAGDVDDALGVGGVVQRHDRADRRDRDADQDQRRDDRQDDLQGGPTVELFRVRLPAITELEHREEHEREHDHADEPGETEHQERQVVDRLGVRPGGLEHVLRGVLRAAGDQRAEAHHEGDADATTHGSHGSRGGHGMPFRSGVTHGTLRFRRADSTPGTKKKYPSGAVMLGRATFNGDVLGAAFVHQGGAHVERQLLALAARFFRPPGCRG